MATASGDAKGARTPVMPYVAYGVVLALLGGAGGAFWIGQKDRPPLPPDDASPSPLASTSPSPPVAVAAPTVAAPAEPAPPAQGLKLPPRTPTPVVQKPPPATPETAPPAAQTPSSPSPTPASPSPTEAKAGDPSPAPAEKPVPPKSKCTVDGSWPADRTDQGKAIQGMLRDLGLYDGTVYGTVGPTTRAAIRKFQVSAGQPETGDPDETLFDSLKKKCAAPAP